MKTEKGFRTMSVLCATLALLGAVNAGEVGFRETETILPTYAPGGYEKTPLFYSGRVYQGAQGRVYPYPMQDVLHDEKADETYKYLTLENDWLHMGLLPEHGGHMLNFTDKQTGFEIFYRQHVIKPALIGMLGAWISGGVEWNFPHHHRATTAMPVDWRMTEQNDGSKTIWIGETELRRGLKWTIGLSMMRDRAVLEAQNVFMNRGDLIESMIYWANVSVHCGDDYQVIFPPSCHLGFDHHKSFWTSFPIGPKKIPVTHKHLPRSRWANDIDGDVDLGWWKNFTVESRSIFAMDPDNAWIAGFDHGRNLGTAHVSNRHLTVGKKFFLWGNFPEAHVWDTVLTDHDGPYLELMVGCWSDNQPDYSWIGPYETRRVKQYWFPVKGIGGVKNVTIDGAVNVDRRGKEELLVGFYSTRVLSNCTVRVHQGSVPSAPSRTVFTEKNVTLDPNTPWCKPVKVDADAADQEFTATVADADGKVFLSYTPVGPDPHDPLPPTVANPKEPAAYESAELAYLTGLRLDQFHNGILDPIPYYRRALEIDPDYSSAHLALGIKLLKNSEFSKAETHLRKAVDRVNQNYMRAKDAEPEYYLAVVCRQLGRYKEAEDLFWRVTWRSTLKKEAYAELARLAAFRGDWREALARIDDALKLGCEEAKFWTIKGVCLRKLGDGRADTCFSKAIELDPLEYWAVVAKDGLEAAERNRGLPAQQLIESVCDYIGIGCIDEAVALCDAADRKASAEAPYRTEGPLPMKDTLAACRSYRSAMFGYLAGYATLLKGDEASARERMAKAAKGCSDYVFPSRLVELAALEAAARLAPAANTYYYLGEILFNLDRKEEGISAWRRAVELQPDHALAWRALGFGLSHPGSYFFNTGNPFGEASREAYDCYRKSFAADPGNFRTLYEQDKLSQKLGVDPRERIRIFEENLPTAKKYDACMLRLAYLYNEVEDYDRALEILTTRRFHVWEGSDNLLQPFVDALLARGRLLLAEGKAEKALEDFQRSLTYPSNLQAGRPGDAGNAPKSYYFIAQAYRALGRQEDCRKALSLVMEGWVNPGEMNYWRVKALREMGKTEGQDENIKELKKGIELLETPPPSVISAYAKFSGDNSPLERAANNAKKARHLRTLLSELEKEQ